MAREWTILAAIGTVLIFSGSPATASVSNSGSDARAVTAAGPVSGAERSGLDELLERSGLRVQLEGLAAGVRVQFLRGQGRISSQDRATEFWTEPDDVQRARTGSVPVSLFAWQTR